MARRRASVTERIAKLVEVDRVTGCWRWVGQTEVRRRAFPPAAPPLRFPRIRVNVILGRPADPVARGRAYADPLLIAWQERVLAAAWGDPAAPVMLPYGLGPSWQRGIVQEVLSLDLPWGELHRRPFLHTPDGEHAFVLHGGDLASCVNPAHFELCLPSHLAERLDPSDPLYEPPAGPLNLFA